VSNCDQVERRETRPATRTSGAQRQDVAQRRRALVRKRPAVERRRQTVHELAWSTSPLEVGWPE